MPVMPSATQANHPNLTPINFTWPHGAFEESDESDESDGVSIYGAQSGVAEDRQPRRTSVGPMRPMVIDENYDDSEDGSGSEAEDGEREKGLGECDVEDEVANDGAEEGKKNGRDQRCDIMEVEEPKMEKPGRGGEGTAGKIGKGKRRPTEDEEGRDAKRRSC
ncbi:hypothetical protein K432DRAFT_464826 [Lepidopterella palustris CBS 459.81]|uniref:Uncharacterized protein n=1 Tax=Lepidopterella palustris CBS 459.81 TaxID=1314670 RepID=A0A8E2E1T8_9PEZI|nr:hypothetical protein K432DRAFT_464826 [Lepidopterella palustris CBS 459.81]